MGTKYLLTLLYARFWVTYFANSFMRPHPPTRLLDVQSSTGRYKHETVFYMVFEHMEQDLDQFIKLCPPPGMQENVVRVSVNILVNLILCCKY